MNASAPQSLRRILGLGFGLAIAFGGTVGVGILRLPGVVAGALGDPYLVILFWLTGGAYALLGAVAVAELAAMLPHAGGFYVYARRAFGSFGGVVGWSDWLNDVSSLAFQAIAAAAVFGSLWPPAAPHARAAALFIVAAFTALHWIGLRFGSRLTCVISAVAGSMLVILAGACFLVKPVEVSAAPLVGPTVASSPLLSMAMLLSVVTALRAVLVTYDGWYAPIRMAEESADPSRTLPRAIIGGTLLITALYVIMNIAYLRVLPLPLLAASQLPAADAARLVLPHGGAGVVTLISLVTLLSIFNAGLMGAPRILLALGRDGFFTRKTAIVSASGTPRVALAVTGVTCALLILTGTFEQIIALSAVLFMLNYVATYVAVFVLRRCEPATPRPYRALGFPLTTTIALIGSLAFLIGAISSDYRSALIAAVLLICGSAFAWIASRRSKSHSLNRCTP